MIHLQQSSHKTFLTYVLHANILPAPLRFKLFMCDGKERGAFATEAFDGGVWALENALEQS